MTTMTRKREGERGNALFLILIAVALFAALSYAVTQSGRGGGSVSKETAVLDSAQLTQFPAAVRTAVTRLVLTNIPISGANDEAINFVDTDDADCGNNNCVFNTMGGGVVAQNPPSSAVSGVGAAGVSGSAGPGWRYKTIKSGGNSYYVRGVGTTAGDIFAFIGVNPNACRAINRGLGLTANPLLQDTAPFDVTVQAEGESTAQVASGHAAEGGNASTIGGAGASDAFACIANVTSGLDDSDPMIYHHTLLEQ